MTDHTTPSTPAPANASRRRRRTLLGALAAAAFLAAGVVLGYGIGSGNVDHPTTTGRAAAATPVPWRLTAAVTAGDPITADNSTRSDTGVVARTALPAGHALVESDVSINPVRADAPRVAVSIPTSHLPAHLAYGQTVVLTDPAARVPETIVVAIAPAGDTTTLTLAGDLTPTSAAELAAHAPTSGLLVSGSR